MAEIQTAVNFKVFLFSNKKAMENVTEILNDESFTPYILVKAGASQLFEDLEACVSVLICARILAVYAAISGVEVITVVVKPPHSAAVRILKAHNIPILQRSTIHSVSGEDLESSVRVG
mgnify:CR=1 FL=1